jgi:hypothetical protein
MAPQQKHPCAGCGPDADCGHAWKMPPKPRNSTRPPSASLWIISPKNRSTIFSISSVFSSTFSVFQLLDQLGTDHAASFSCWPHLGCGVTFDREINIMLLKWQKFLNITMLLQPVRALRHQKNPLFGKRAGFLIRKRGGCVQPKLTSLRPSAPHPGCRPAMRPNRTNHIAQQLASLQPAACALTEKLGFFERSKPVTMASSF